MVTKEIIKDVIDQFRNDPEILFDIAYTWGQRDQAEFSGTEMDLTSMITSKHSSNKIVVAVIVVGTAGYFAVKHFSRIKAKINQCVARLATA